jgi:hypothetical protein
MPRKFFITIFSAILALAGCAPEMREPEEILPGKKTLAEALSVLRSRSDNIGSLRANGRCRWLTQSDGKSGKEEFSVKLWLNPPAEVYLQGDVGFNPRGIVLGSNASEFWLLIKPEVSRYSWGKWSEQGSTGGLMFVPKTLDEALGIVEVVDEEEWTFFKEGDFDVLVRRDNENRIVKKIYINRRDYLTRRIEYFDVNGKAAAIAELDRYKEVSKDFYFPTSISIIMRGGGGDDDSASIILNLQSVKSASFTETQRNALFNPPPTKGYKNIYRIIDGHMVEEPV